MDEVCHFCNGVEGLQRIQVEISPGAWGKVRICYACRVRAKLLKEQAEISPTVPEIPWRHRTLGGKP